MNLDDTKTIREAFQDAVNMSPAELERWLMTEHSKEVGCTHEGESRSIGHHSGRRIIDIKRKRVAEPSEDDYAHMRTSTGTWRSARRAMCATHAGAGH